MCSIVETDTPLSFSIFVQSRASETIFQRAAIIRSPWSMSVRRNQMPVSADAGLTIIIAGIPECSPTPSNRTGDLTVFCTDHPLSLASAIPACPRPSVRDPPVPAIRLSFAGGYISTQSLQRCETWPFCVSENPLRTFLRQFKNLKTKKKPPLSRRSNSFTLRGTFLG